MPGGFDPPLSVIASWPTPNYVNPITRGSSLTIGSAFLVGFTLLVVCARLWTRLVIVKRPGLDDLLVVIAMLLSISLLAIVSLAFNRYGWDRHIWDVKPELGVRSAINSWIGMTLYIWSSSCVKLSVLFFSRRIMGHGGSRILRWSILACIILISLYIVAFELALLFACRPLEAYWLRRSFPKPYRKKYVCQNEGASIMASAVVSVVTDFLVTLLPLALFKQLQIGRKQKWSLYVVFGLGFLVCIAGTFRMVYIWKTFYETYDTTWTGYYIWCWTAAEVDISIICASAPALKPLFKRYFHSSTKRYNICRKCHQSYGPSGSGVYPGHFERTFSEIRSAGNKFEMTPYTRVGSIEEIREESASHWSETKLTMPEKPEKAALKQNAETEIVYANGPDSLLATVK